MRRALVPLLVATPVLLGTVYAHRLSFPTRWGALALALAAALLGASAAGSARSNRLVAGACVTVSLVLAAALVPGTGAAILGIAVLSVALASVCVTPLTRDLAGLGEAAAFLVGGPLLVSAGYLAQSRELSSGALLVSLPAGLLAATVLFTTHFAHAAGQQDPMCPLLVLGPSQSRLVLGALPVLAFLSLALDVRLSEVPAASLCALAAAPPLAWKLRSDPGDTFFVLGTAAAAEVLVVAGFLAG